MSTEPRLNFHALAPQAAKALGMLSAATRRLDPRLRELVNLRLSQINGCAFCIDMHWADLLRQGVDPRHVNAVAGWREAHRFFSERERAALNWAEAVNAIPHGSPTDEDFRAAQRHFTPEELAELTFAVGAIRSWNMLNVSFQMPVPEEPYVAAH